MSRNKKEMQELNNYLATIQFLNEGTSDYFFVWDIQEERVYFAGDVYEKYPLPFRGKEGNTVKECKSVIYTRDLKSFENQMQLIASGREDACNIECRVVDKKECRAWATFRGKCRADDNGIPEWMVGRISTGELQLKVDSLTGMFNVDKFMEDMHKCQEMGGSGYLLLMGIDNLKNINIKYGREFGNHILKKVTESLEDEINSSMGIYRLDGDRFAVMLPGAGESTVENLYKSVQKDIKEYCTVSAGSAYCSPECQEDCDRIFQYAEDALDCAKKEGKNVLRFFSRDSYIKRLDMLRLQEELCQSVHENCKGFYLCFQPMMNNRDFSLRGCEALLRYRSPSRGEMGPVEFIPLLEQTELICPIGEWVLKTALRQCRKWRKLVPDFRVNVNISYVQLRKEGICERVLEILKKSGLPGSALTLEVTESMQLEDYEYYNKIFFRWKMAGIQIAIDDFGTGYSSLSYLKSIVSDEVKIDRCFVSNLQHSTYNYKLMKNVIELAHSADIRVCCEGVETEEELMVLRELEPDVLQGYFFGKPCEKDEFERKCIRENVG